MPHYRSTRTGRVAYVPDELTVQYDAAPVWERVDDADTEPGSTAPDGQDGPDGAPTTENPSEAPAAAPAATEAPPPAKDVRAWARAEGLDVPARGPLPDDLVERYVAAHAEG